jgi:iron complex outermembrane receptor protein
MLATTRGRRAAVATASLLALAAGLAHADGAVAQTAAPASGAKSSDTAAATLVEEVVVGTRASLQSAIGRKKRAQTTVDSIVADDVASFPDKNVAEALQRVTGVQISREFGEGNGISIRGVENDLNRVEINGASTLGFNGGRGADFRELSADMIKTVDVYKGSIASLTEGGVGGTVIVETLQPLEVGKPFLNLSVQAEHVDTINTTKPRIGVSFADKFLDDRLGISSVFTYDEVDTRSDNIKNNSFFGGTNVTATTADTYAGGNLTVRGAGVGGDFDQSPEKTYNNPLYSNITTKAGCVGVNGLTLAQIPGLQPWTPANPATGRTNTAAPQPAGTLTAAQHFGASTNPCLAQWNDYMPQLARYGVWTRDSKRLSGVATVQYEINDAFNVFLEYSRDQRKTLYQDNTLQLGITNPNNLDLTTDASGKLVNLVVGPNHTVVDYRSNTDLNVIPGNSGNSTVGQVASGLNLLSSGSRRFYYNTLGQYLKTGFNYREGPLQIKGLAVHSWNHLYDETNAIGFAADVPGSVRVKLDDAGNPQIILPSGVDLNNAAFWNRPSALNYRPSDAKEKEDMVKVDFDFDVDRFGITKVEWGGQIRKFSATLYRNGGYTIPASGTTPAYVVLGSNQTPLPTLAPASNPGLANNGRGQSLAQFLAGTPNPQIWSPAYLAQYVAAAGHQTPGTWTPGGSDGVGFDAMKSWLTPDWRVAEQFFDLSTFTRKYLFEDANGIPKAPDQDLEENTNAIYGMVDYDFTVLGMDVSGNFGVRYVKTQLDGTSLSTRIERVLTNPACNQVTTTCATTTVTRNVSINTIHQDYSNTLPSFNLAVGVIPSKLIVRASWAKVMARPKPADIVRGISCTYDVTPIGQSDTTRDVCTAGNPALKPYLADTYDLNIGWYPNRDTLINAGVFYKNIGTYMIGNTLRTGVDLFNDGTLFDVTQPTNGKGAKLSGFELSAQTAFTFLPAPFDGFGANLNYTYTDTPHSNTFSVVTGEEMPFAGLSKNSYNIIGFYDKGPYNLRIAYNYRDQWLTSYPAATAVTGTFVDAAGYLDAKFTYRVPNSGLSLSVEGKNLTGETDRRTQGPDIQMVTNDYSGKRYFVGLAWKF